MLSMTSSPSFPISRIISRFHRLQLPASGAGGRRFEPGPRHTKDVKNGTSSYLALRSAFIMEALASLLSLSISKNE